MAKKDKQMIKIVYFDEGSVTDFIYVLNGGKNTDKKEHIITKTTELAAGAEAEANKSANVLSILSAKIGVGANADFTREGNTIITKAIESTLLTDYLEYISKNGKSYIKIFSNCKPYPYPKSFAFFKMLTPYLKMTNGQIEVTEGLSLNLSLMDEALDSGRGYYELMVDYNGETAVLRFNINAFRNNYNLADFLKMKLTYYGVPVGKLNLENLKIENEFNYINKPERVSAERVFGDVTEESVDECTVYDVIIAGVSHE